MNIETVNELITSLESAGELSIRETKVMALAKAYQQLAAENVALKQAVAEEIEVINRGGQRYCVKDGMSINPIYARGWNDHRSNVTALQTPATDRIVAEAEARGVEKGIAHLEKKFSNIGVQIMNLQWLADSLREGGATNEQF
ncbi:TPA: hypothetical protein ME633_001255 [Klebsiella pneumoniae]|nr:hypothetical protein [Klebsiella pneumoniae]HBW5333799.1 hypothetical protein [Klebsiella pneumoniae]HBW5631698.1 hypothetical protein [Klebsiella pneumoniae]